MKCLSPTKSLWISVCQAAYSYREIAYPCEKADLPQIRSTTLGHCHPWWPQGRRCPTCPIQGSLGFLCHSPVDPKSEEVLKGEVSLNFKTDSHERTSLTCFYSKISNLPSSLNSFLLLRQLYVRPLSVCTLCGGAQEHTCLSYFETFCPFKSGHSASHLYSKLWLQFTAGWDCIACKEISGITESLQRLLCGEKALIIWGMTNYHVKSCRTSYSS